MPDTKISALPVATTPLGGTEVLPIVQGGATKRVAVSSLPAGTGGAAAWGSITGTLASQTDLNTALNARQVTSEKGQVNGYAGLDGTGKVPAAQLPAAGGTSFGKVVTDYAGATFDAKLDALIASLVDGDTIILPAGSYSVASQHTITGLNGLRWFVSPRAIVTMSGTTAWGSDGNTRAAIRFMDCNDLIVEGGEWRMNSASNSAKLGQWFIIFAGTANGFDSKPATIASERITFRNMNFSDIVTTGLFCRLVNHVRLEQCHFLRASTNTNTNSPLCSILDGRGHRIISSIFNGNVPNFNFAGQPFFDNSAGVNLSCSNPWSFFDPLVNTSRTVNYRAKFTFSGSVNSFTVTETATNDHVYELHWTETDPVLWVDHATMHWRFVVDPASGMAARGDDLFKATATNRGTKTLTFQPTDRLGAQTTYGSATNPATVYISGTRLSGWQKDVAVIGCHFHRTRGVGVFPWGVDGLNVIGNTAEDCVDIAFDCEMVRNANYIGNHYRRTAALPWTNAFIALIYYIENVNIIGNVCEIEAGARLEHGIDAGPTGQIQRNILVAGNSGSGWDIMFRGLRHGSSPTYSCAAHIAIKDNRIDGMKGAGQQAFERLIRVEQVIDTTIEGNKLGGCEKHPIAFMRCKGLVIRNNEVYGGGTEAVIARELQERVGGVPTGPCDSIDVEIYDNIATAMDSAAPAHVSHEIAPTGSYRIYNNRGKALGSTSPTTKVQQYNGAASAAIVPTGPSVIQIGGAWFRVSGGVLQQSTDSTDGANGAWSPVNT